jgi:cytochrome bd-type quinol oxidase subunit 2
LARTGGDLEGLSMQTTTPMSLNYLLGVLCFILWIVALVDCIKSSNPNKIIWIIVIILLPFLGSILYFLIGRGKA